MITVRHYDRDADYERIGRFLVATFGAPGPQVNWLQPRWEYMHYHPLIREADLSVIGVWEADGEIVAVAHPEHAAGSVYFQIHPDHGRLKAEMLTYAEEHLSTAADGGRRLSVYIGDDDESFQRLAAGRGYVRGGGRERMSRLSIPSPFPEVPPPEGFRLKSLADDNDLRKVDRALWRGFDHGHEPPDGGIDDRRFMQSAPNYRKDLNIVVEAPDGNFVSYCGMWHEPVHAIAYVEPVATDPDYRRRGLARAAVMEGVRRCGRLGATTAWVGSTKPLYLALGFEQVSTSSAWQREWT